jgi:hypothetical protein
MWLHILLFVIGLITFSYWYLTKEFGYFKARGICEPPASFPFGSEPAKRIFTGKLSTWTFLNQFLSFVGCDYFNLSDKPYCVRDHHVPFKQN